MARTVLTAVLTNGPYPTEGVLITPVAADTSNQNRVLLTGRQVLFARNSGASTRTITITSVGDSVEGRLGTITAENILAGQVKLYGPFATDGWRQTDGYLWFEANHAEVLFWIVTV
jgi:hypothetical protein